MSRAPIRRAMLMGALSAVLAAAMLPAAAAAATRPITFGLYLGSSCLNGRASDSVQIRIVWRSASGALKLKQTYTTGSAGSWEACANLPRVLALGDTIKATVGTTTRKFTVPHLTLRMNRVTDVFKGQAPAGTTVELNFAAGLFADFDYSKTLTADANGRWKYKRPSFDIIGGLYAYLRWFSGSNDTITLDRTAPYARLTLGLARVTGAADPGALVKAKLLDTATSTVRAKLAATAGSHGGFTAKFRNAAGNAVPVLAGDRFRSASLAGDADWIVPATQASANASTNVVTGLCHDAGTRAGLIWVKVLAPDGDTRGQLIGSTAADGSFDIDFDDPAASEGVTWWDAADVQSGDTILVSCLQVTGDWVDFRQSVP